MTHAPHAVDAKLKGETRWAALFAYARPDPERRAWRKRHFPFVDWGRELGIPGAEGLMLEY